MSVDIEGSFAEPTAGLSLACENRGVVAVDKMPCSHVRCAAADDAADSVSCWRSSCTTRIYTAHRIDAGRPLPSRAAT